MSSVLSLSGQVSEVAELSRSSLYAMLSPPCKWEFFAPISCHESMPYCYVCVQKSISTNSNIIASCSLACYSLGQTKSMQHVSNIKYYELFFYFMYVHMYIYIRDKFHIDIVHYVFLHVWHCLASKALLLASQVHIHSCTVPCGGQMWEIDEGGPRVANQKYFKYVKAFEKYHSPVFL